MTIEISVVICTYNRSDILKNVLETVVNQTVDQSFYEVIIVDNCSTDQTESQVRNFSRLNTNIRYVLEKRVGLSHARNRGWKEARGRYVAYTDDDCELPEEWLTIALQIIENVEPDIFGGPYYPYYLSPKADWFKDEYGNWGYGFDFTVDPLPFRNMSGFPYPSSESYPYDDAHLRYMQEYNTRDIKAPQTAASSLAIWVTVVIAIVAVTDVGVLVYFRKRSR